MLLDPQRAHAFKLADGIGASQPQRSSRLGKSRGRLGPPQSTCITAATESTIPLQNCHLWIAATFLFIPGKEKSTLHPTKLLLGNESNPEALLKDDQTILFVRSTKGTKAYKPNQDYLQPMRVGFAQGANSIKNLGSYLGMRRTIKLSLLQKNRKAEG